MATAAAAGETAIAAEAAVRDRRLKLVVDPIISFKRLHTEVKGFLKAQGTREVLGSIQFALAGAYKELAKSTGVTEKDVRKAVEGFLTLPYPTAKNTGKRGLKMELRFKVKPLKASLKRLHTEMKAFLNTQYSRGELEKREFALAPAYKELAKSTGVTKKRVRKAVEGFLALAFPTGKTLGNAD